VDPVGAGADYAEIVNPDIQVELAVGLIRHLLAGHCGHTLLLCTDARYFP
jgi:hypothetical protein